MITFITGKLFQLLEDRAILDIFPFHIEVWITEYTRRQIQNEVGKEVALFTIATLDGNVAQGKISPRLLGFISEEEREFFNLFCSVDGIGTKKALRAMEYPPHEIASAIGEQDAEFLARLSGIGPGIAERIISKLRRKVPKLVLMKKHPKGKQTPESLNVIAETYEALVQLGYTEAEAHKLIEKETEGGKRTFSDSGALIKAIYANK